jgi:hypothetical protein
MPSARPKNRFWRLCRIYFRRFRIFIWIITIVLLSAVLYVNRVGVPEFVKRPLVNKLREHGVALEFAQLRWHWGEGFVAHDVIFGSMDEPAAPQLLAEKVQIQLNSRALFRGRLQVDSLGLQSGRLEWIPVNSNAPIRALTVANIQAQLRLLPGDQWRLDDLRAQFAGAHFLVSASVTNATAVRDWDILKGAGTAATTRWPERLQKLAETLESISFSSPPELRLALEGDARNLQSFAARLNLAAERASTPWGQAESIEFISRLFPATSNELSHAEMDLTAVSAQTKWARTTNLNLQLRLVSLAPQPDVVDASLSLRASAAVTPWASVSPIQMKARWVHAVTNPMPQSGQIELAVETADTPWARAAGVQFHATLAPATNGVTPDPTLAWWTNLLPYQLHWSAEARAVKSFELEAENVRAEGNWCAPQLAITNLHAKLYRGALDIAARLDILTRRFAFNAAGNFDLKRLAPVLAGESRAWLEKLTWSEPPWLRCSGAFTWPDWTERNPDWRAAILPSLELGGGIAATNCAFAGIYANWLNTGVTCTNRVWSLPDFMAGRPEGQIAFAHTVNETNGNFYFRLRSTLEASPVRSFLSAQGQQAFDWCEFTSPPLVEGELWGNWSDLERTGFRGQLALTNFTFRELHVDAAVTQLHYTNRVLSFLEPRAWNGPQNMRAKLIAADFNAMRIYFTNAFAVFDPRPVTRAIGPQVHEIMSPYHFLAPPTARVEGFAPLTPDNVEDADLVFEAVAAPFEVWKFSVPRVSARVHWLRDTLTLTNVQVKFYGGDATGWAHFVFPKEPGTKFAFTAHTTNTNLRLLMNDLTSPTNNLDGQMNVNLTITDAHTENALSWNGYGDAQLRDGLIWSIPIFGVLSKPLDAIVPGVGNSPVSSATASFVISNSVIHSRDLEMRSPAMRLQYRGTVDFDGQVQARVTAEPLRGTPLLGPVVNVALWPVTRLFQYKITGSLADPKPEPVYIPKILLSPFKTLEDLFTPGPGFTNAPPEIK